jgi:hypothetical protein
MDNRKVYQWAKIDSVPTIITSDEKFQFNKRAGWHWLQRLCFFVLDKIGANGEETVEIFTRTSQQNDDILKSLLGQEDGWLRQIRHQECRIYMGPDGYADLMMLVRAMDMRPLCIGDARIEIGMDRHERTWHNIPITVVPWMMGVVLVPAD